MPPGQEPTQPPAGADLRKPLHVSSAPAIAGRDVPKDLNELAFATVRELGELVRRRKVSSLALTEMYIARLKKYDPTLHFVVTITEERALAQAKEADKEIAAGKYRSHLHGLPWGGKDLLAVKGYRTTWGAGGFEDQMIDEDAVVVQRLGRRSQHPRQSYLPGRPLQRCGDLCACPRIPTGNRLPQASPTTCIKTCIARGDHRHCRRLFATNRRWG
jgi:hypothetical protein